MACLASRIPYGSPVTLAKLTQVAEAEAFLRGLGFGQLRLRHHGEVARLEVSPGDMGRAVDLGPQIAARSSRSLACMLPSTWKDIEAAVSMLPWQRMAEKKSHFGQGDYPSIGELSSSWGKGRS